jgi:hypothetical protein
MMSIGAAMDMTISIPEEVASKLEERAAVAGKTLRAYTAELVTETVTQPSLEEMLAVSQGEFASTGMTEAEMIDLGRDLLDKVRSEKALRK